jgi:hypothetical protein
MPPNSRRIYRQSLTARLGVEDACRLVMSRTSPPARRRIGAVR